jgi:hypothetical protein
MFPSDAVSRVFPLVALCRATAVRASFIVPDDIGGRKTVQLPCSMKGIMLVL